MILRLENSKLSKDLLIVAN